jgi:hypothetical protein
MRNAYAPGVRHGRDLRDVFRRSVTVTGSFSYCRQHGSGDLPDALRMLPGRPAWALPLVGHRFPLDDLPAAVGAVTARGCPEHRPVRAVLAAGNRPAVAIRSGTAQKRACPLNPCCSPRSTTGASSTNSITAPSTFSDSISISIRVACGGRN